MSNEANNKSIQLRIKRIKLLSFDLNESISTEEARAGTITLAQNLHFDMPGNAIVLRLKATGASLEGTVIVQAVVENVFEVKDLQVLTNPEDTTKITLPQPLLVTILSLSISHTRALVAQNVMGSKYDELYIPILDPVETATILFKDYIDENQPVK